MALPCPSIAVRLAGAASAAMALAACGTTQTATQAGGGVSSDDYRDAIGVFSSAEAEQGMDPIAAAAFWGTRYNTEHANPEIAVRFSQALRKIGSNEEAANVMQKAAGQFAGDSRVNLEYGKVLVESGRAFEAVRYLESAVQAEPNNWRALSAYGVALDQIGEHAQARRTYDRALAMSPGQASLLNNKGLSYALEGDLARAKLTLRNAVSAPGGDARMRQNLALVLAIGGDIGEAERLARSDLPPMVANNNIDVFRQLVNQPAYWGEYAANTVNVPAFEETPAAPLAPTPRLREEPRPTQEEKEPDGAPIALMEAAPAINASAPAETSEDNKTDDAQN